MEKKQGLIITSLGFFLVGSFSIYFNSGPKYIQIGYLILGFWALMKYIRL